MQLHLILQRVARVKNTAGAMQNAGASCWTFTTGNPVHMMRTARTETGREEVPERNSLDPRFQSCMAMTRLAPTEQKGGDLKGHA